MRWYEYKMEADDLHAPEDLKAKLLAMAGTLPEEEKNRPMMPAQADNTAVVRPQELPQRLFVPREEPRHVEDRLRARHGRAGRGQARRQ